MANSDFNKLFNLCITIGMTAVMAITTAIKLQQSDTDSAMLLVAAFGSLMGILANVCSANAKILTFLFGIFDVSIYGVMCYLSGTYGTAALKLLYFLPMQFIGFYQWRKRGSQSKSKSLLSRRLKPAGYWICLVGFFILTSIVYFVLCKLDGTAASLLKTAILTDALSTTCNIFGQLLMSTAYVEQWVFWIGVNISSIILWSVKTINGQASDFGSIYIIKYSFYLLNSLNGLRIWLKLSKN